MSEQKIPNEGPAMKTYRDWPLFEELPEGWRIDKAASPLHGYKFCVTGHYFKPGGLKRGLVRVLPPQLKIAFDAPEKKQLPEICSENKSKSEPQIIDGNYVRTVNELARQKFKHRLLKDIMIDLMVCEIEGWGKLEYISELKKLINSLAQQECINNA